MKITIRLKPNASVSPLPLRPTLVKVQTRPLRILDFDVEARPLHWISSDYVSKEITAIAWAWIVPNTTVSCYLLGESRPQDMLTAFLDAYHHADLVTGHYIRGYDLPMINGALSECGMPALEDKMAQDTKIDLIRRQGLSSSQENLGTMFGLDHPKVKMDQTSWRDANRLTHHGLALTRARVCGDVIQHIELRQRLLALGYLRAPSVWSSRGDSTASETYIP